MIHISTPGILVHFYLVYFLSGVSPILWKSAADALLPDPSSVPHMEESPHHYTTLHSKHKSSSLISCMLQQRGFLVIEIG